MIEEEEKELASRSSQRSVVAMSSAKFTKSLVTHNRKTEHKFLFPCSVHRGVASQSKPVPQSYAFALWVGRNIEHDAVSSGT